MKNVPILLITFLVISCGSRSDVVQKTTNKNPVNEAQTPGPDNNHATPDQCSKDWLPVKFSSKLSFPLYPVGQSEDFSISEAREKGSLLVFAGLDCKVCQEETQLLIETKSQWHEHIDITTIMALAILEDAQEWQERFEQSWPLGFWDVDRREYVNMCPPLGQTPCAFYFPKNEVQGVAYRKLGKIEVNDLKCFDQN